MYAANNPIRFVDVLGLGASEDQDEDEFLKHIKDVGIMNLQGEVSRNDFESSNSNPGDPTKYVNSKGETLYETNDNLTDIVVIKDYNLTKFERKLNKVAEKGELNSAETNKKELHTMGTNLFDLDNEATKGAGLATDAYLDGYRYGFKNQKINYLGPFMYWGAGESGDGKASEAGRYSGGNRRGKSDSEKGRINILNPTESLKNNTPLIRLYQRNTNIIIDD